MTIKYVKLIALTSILLGSVSSSYAGTRHNPNEVFFNDPRGTAINVNKATGAEALHAQGIKGQGQTIAIIDDNFLAKDLQVIQSKGLLHPLAIQEDTVSISKNGPHINSSRKGKDPHGTDVMNTVHMVAPGATLLPIDAAYLEDQDDYTDPMVRAVRTAIKANASVINLSITSPDKNKGYIKSLKEAIRKGIIIVFAAGNDSERDDPWFLNEIEDDDGRIVPQNEKVAFDQAGKKGIIFAGATKIKSSGLESYASYSTHPTKDTASHYIATIGEGVPVPGRELFSGTSAAAPIIAANYALLKQYSQLHGTVSPELLVRELHTSGEALNHSIKNTPVKTYKSLNIKNAMKRIYNRFKNKVASILPVKSASVKPAAKNVASKPAPKQATKATAKRVAKPTIRQVIKGPAKRVAKAVAKNPTSRRVIKKVAKRDSKPAAKRTTNPVGRRVSKPATRRISTPIAKRLSGRAVKGPSRVNSKRIVKGATNRSLRPVAKRPSRFISKRYVKGATSRALRAVAKRPSRVYSNRISIIATKRALRPIAKRQSRVISKRIEKDPTRRTVAKRQLVSQRHKKLVAINKRKGTRTALKTRKASTRKANLLRKTRTSRKKIPLSHNSLL